MNDTLSINIKIDNRIYPLVVSRKDEERFRTAAKKLNEVVQSYRNDYPDKDSQDILAMTAFMLVHNNVTMLEKAGQSPLINDLKDIKDDIAEFLEQKSVKRF
jgi:cell division protein ZapA